MGYNAPQPSELFSDAGNGTEVVNRFEAYKGELAKSAARAATGNFRWGGPASGGGSGRILEKSTGGQIAERVANLTKGLTADQLASMQGDIDAIKGVVEGDLNKDWSLFSPDSAGLVPFDLEAPAKLLVPRMTPLRNRLPRTKGQGTALVTKRITGWSNSGVGGNTDLTAFFSSESASTAFGPLSLRRPGKISYTANDKSYTYREQGLSDQVSMLAEFAGRGYQDIRSLSQTALLWATLGAEERALLFARGTSANGYVGPIAAPVISSATSTTGGTLAAGTWQIRVTARSGAAGGAGGGSGESVVSNELAQVTTGATSTITVTVGTEPNGAVGYNLYVSLVGGASNSETFQYAFAGNTTTFGAQIPGGAAQPAAVDSSANALAYDGFLTVQADPTQGGYIKRVNASVLANGDAAWQSAFLTMYGGSLNPGGGGAGNKLLADPDEVWVDGQTRNSIGQWLKLNASTVSYRLVLDAGGSGDAASGAMVGSAIGGFINQTTGSMANLLVHPYMPLGCSLIRSSSLPAAVPDSNISNTAEVRNVQDYMSIDWPVIQMTYDASTYLFGTLVHYAPAWSGLLLGLLP
jgi:hypothetical protein